MPAPFRIYDTMSGDVRDFVPQAPGKIGLYVCGMTVYDHAHVGHARAFVVFDAFVRYLRYRGWDVTFVRNFTDVDDKIIKRANENGEDPVALAQNFIDSFHADTAALGLIAPNDEPRVSESMDEILAMITELLERGHAYVQDGSVWFSVETFSDYGGLSRQKVDELRSPDEVPGKRAPADFALWKAAKPGEPFWDSAWGPGRPGWHIECSAMSRDRLGMTVDIHGGGLDLKFPHHENEIAQSQCGNGTTYVNYWMHNGLLTMSDGVKMGKSLGNAINIKEALYDYPAEAVRLYYLQNHYRSPLPWSPEALPEALGKLARLYEAREVAEAMGGSEDAERVAKDLGEDAQRVLTLGREFVDRFHEVMDDDFNSARALGLIFELARAVNALGNHKKAKKRAGAVVADALAAFEVVGRAVGLLVQSSADFQDEVKAKRLRAMELDRDAIETKLAERTQARADKDWARSDAVRDELEKEGIQVMDGAAGVEWRVRL